MSAVVTAPSGGFRLFLNLVGIAVVGSSAAAALLRGDVPLWATAGILIADLCWLAVILLGVAMPGVTGLGVTTTGTWRTVAARILVGLMVAGGAISAAATNGVGVVPVAVALLLLTRDTAILLRVPITTGAGAMLLVLIGDALAPITPLGLLAIEAGVVVAFLSGQSRRQSRVADEQDRKLLETGIIVREEQARADVLAARQHIAHDIHDVLAHSLGGLVIQLDAVEALLEAGDTDAALARVRAARSLAAEGLTDARRAVAALRENQDDARERVSGDRLCAEISKLLGAHRALGGTVEFAESGERRDVGAPLESAMRRAVQEALTNARKHAPGAPVSVQLEWRTDDLRVRISNPLPATSVSTHGGGHGLLGMRERFASVPGGSATAGIEVDRFVVEVGGAN